MLDRTETARFPLHLAAHFLDFVLHPFQLKNKISLCKDVLCLDIVVELLMTTNRPTKHFVS